MLVVRRRAGQSVLIGDDIEIQITEIGPTKVTLGIKAPKTVAVMRAEVKLTREQNAAAAEAVPPDSLAKLASALRLR
jgi:carbon storage regulator